MSKLFSKKKKRLKVNRSYDGIDRPESTAGLMALRIFVVFVMIAFIVGTALLFAYNFSKEAENVTVGRVSDTTGGEEGYYQIYDSDVSSQLLEYYSKYYPAGENVEPKLVQYENIRVNALMAESLERMCKAASNDGIIIEITRGYMTHSECESYFRELTLHYEELGDSTAVAQNKAADIFPPAKENEYRTGMLIKLSNSMDSDFETSGVYKWMFKNGVNYGFINRYTEDKEEITGVTGDTTVYRFVGTENAKKMRQFGMCLEEYAEYVNASKSK